MADRSAVSTITVEGKSVGGQVSRAAPAAKTISITSKGEEGVNEQTFTVGPNASIVIGDDKSTQAKLEDVTVGMGANVQLSARDPKTATSIHAFQSAKP